MAASARCRASWVLTRTLSTTNSASCSTNSLRIRPRCRVKNLRRSASAESWASWAIDLRVEVLLRVPGIGKTQILELPAKPLDASLARESNGAYGEPQLLGNFGDGRDFRFGQVLIGVATDHPPALPLQAVTLVVSHLHQPFRKRARLTQFRQAHQEFGTSGLKNIRRLLGREPVFYRDGINQSLVFVDEQRPGFFASGQALFDEKRVVPNDRLVFPGS